MNSQTAKFELNFSYSTETWRKPHDPENFVAGSSTSMAAYLASTIKHDRLPIGVRSLAITLALIISFLSRLQDVGAAPACNGRAHNLHHSFNLHDMKYDCT